jgi:predicted CoA-binding protein
MEDSRCERTVVVLGASNKPELYSNMAVCLLKECGYRVVPVHPRLRQIEGFPAASRLEEISGPVDTLTLYVGPQRSEVLIDAIIGLRPGRVIFNPGTESLLLERRLKEEKIPFIRGCTIVMLQSGQF